MQFQRSITCHAAKTIRQAICSALILGTAAVVFASAQEPDPASSADELRPEVEAILEKIELDTHKRAVWNAARRIIAIRDQVPAIEKADPLLAEVGALLHDVGGGGARNSRPGAEITLRLLTELEFEKPLVEATALIVETHHVTNDFEEVAATSEWKIVLVADSPAIYPAFMSEEEFAAWKGRRDADAFRYDFDKLRTSEEAFVAAILAELRLLEKRVEAALEAED